MPKECVKIKMKGGMSRKAAVKACYSKRKSIVDKAAKKEDWYEDADWRNFGGEIAMQARRGERKERHKKRKADPFTRTVNKRIAKKFR